MTEQTPLPADIAHLPPILRSAGFMLAADAIERLARDNEALRIEHDAAFAERNRLQAALGDRIKTLQAEHDTLAREKATILEQAKVDQKARREYGSELLSLRASVKALEAERDAACAEAATLGTSAIAADEYRERCEALAAERDALRKALQDIKQATVEGCVCDDVAWFDTITTLHDFCDAALRGSKGDDHE